MSDADATQARQDVAVDVDEIIEHVINANMLSMPYDVYSELFDAVDGLGVKLENLQSENAKLRMLIDLKETCWKYIGWCDECPYNGADDEHDNCSCTMQEKIKSLARELGIEVEQ